MGWIGLGWDSVKWDEVLSWVGMSCSQVGWVGMGCNGMGQGQLCAPCTTFLLSADTGILRRILHVMYTDCVRQCSGPMYVVSDGTRGEGTLLATSSGEELC